MISPQVFINNTYKTIIEKITKIASIPSPPFEEKEKINFLKQQISKCRKFQKIQIDKEGNLSAFYPGQEKKNILLVAHTDTALKLEQNPIYKKGKYLHGHGVCDNSAGVTALLFLIEFLSANKIVPYFNLIFLFTVGEEGIGGKRGMKYFLKNHSQIDAVINVESHDMGRITTSAIGQYRAKINVICEKGGHSFRDFGNPNPICILANLIHDLQRSKLFKKKETTYTFSLIEGGQSINAIPTDASVMYEFRSLSNLKYNRVYKFFSTKIEKIKKQYSDCKLEIHVINNSPPVSLERRHPLIKYTEKIHQELKIDSFYKDGNSDGDATLALGIPTVTIGTSKGFQTHSIHEYMDMESIKKGYLQLFSMILKLDRLKI